MAEPTASDLASAAPIWRPLTLADAAAINALGAAIVPPVPDPQEVEDALGMLRELALRISRDHVLMRDLAAAADELIAAWPDRRARPEEGVLNRWARAQHMAAVALGAVMRVRAAQAIVAMRERSQEVAR